MKEAPARKRERHSVQSVDRALDLLEALAGTDGEVSITAVASRTGLHVSTAHRLLATLLRRGYVRQNPDTSRYYAGAKLATLAEGRSRFGELRLRARALLQSLAESTRETANLSVLDDTAAVLQGIANPVHAREGRQQGGVGIEVTTPEPRQATHVAHDRRRRHAAPRARRDPRARLRGR